jgi:hypothetical protein
MLISDLANLLVPAHGSGRLKGFFDLVAAFWSARLPSTQLARSV